MISGDTQHTLTIAHTERVGVSANANPTIRVHFTNGMIADTQTDASIGYGIQNSDLHGVPLLVTLTSAGRIRYAKIAKG